MWQGGDPESCSVAPGRVQRQEIGGGHRRREDHLLYPTLLIWLVSSRITLAETPGAMFDHVSEAPRGTAKLTQSQSRC